MELVLHNIGKRFRFDWIFRKVTLQLEHSRSYALSGPNGSGKSTFLKVLSGHLTPTKGKIQFIRQGKPLELDALYREVNFAAPYIELIEEMTLKEALQFHRRFKAFRQNLRVEDVVERLGFQDALDKELRYFSSGMKQRLKLALALCSKGQLLLLDEPTTNLDAAGAAWYRQLIEDFGKNRLLVIASNVPADFDFCDKQLNILDYKN